MWGAILGSVLGGGIQAMGARSAARAQTDAANRQLALQREVYDTQRADFAPYVDAGGNALAALNFEYGLGGRPAGYRGYQASPGYAAALRGGQQAIDGSAAARGGLFSGATLAAQQRMGTDLAQADYGNFLAGLGSLMGAGQNSVAGTATAAGNFGSMASGSLGSIGDARSAGAIGIGNALSDGLNNGIGLWGYQNLMNPGGTAAGSVTRPVARGQAQPGGFGNWLSGLFGGGV